MQLVMIGIGRSDSRLPGAFYGELISGRYGKFQVNPSQAVAERIHPHGAVDCGRGHNSVIFHPPDRLAESNPQEP